MNQALRRIVLFSAMVVLSAASVSAQVWTVFDDATFTTSGASNATFTNSAVIGQGLSFLTKSASYTGNDFEDDFVPTGLNATYWGTGNWPGGGTTSVGSGTAAMNGSYIATNNQFAVGTEITFRANFQDDDYQNIGFSVTTQPLVDQFVKWFVIGRGGYGNTQDGNLFLRDFTGQEVLLGSGLTGSNHIFTLKYVSATTFSVAVDFGTPVSFTYGTDPNGGGVGIPGPGTTGGLGVTFMASDNVSTQNKFLNVDWVRVNPVFATTGTYISPAYQVSAGQKFYYNLATWQTYTGTNIAVSVAANNTGDFTSATYTPISFNTDFSADNIKGEYLQFKVDMTDNSAAVSPYLTFFTFYALNITPVTFESLRASAVDKNVTLDWATASESNNKGFQVQRSTDLVKWTNLGFVEGNGNSNTRKVYTYQDKGLDAGKYFYRLQQSDIDGRTSLSNTVSATITRNQSFGLGQSYPNPSRSSSVITYSIAQNSRVRITMYDASGRLVKVVEDAQRSAGSYTISIDQTRMDGGVYIYKMEANGFTATKKMVIQK